MINRDWTHVLSNNKIHLPPPICGYYPHVYGGDPSLPLTIEHGCCYIESKHPFANISGDPLIFAGGEQKYLHAEKGRPPTRKGKRIKAFRVCAPRTGPTHSLIRLIQHVCNYQINYLCARAEHD